MVTVIMPTMIWHHHSEVAISRGVGTVYTRLPGVPQACRPHHSAGGDDAGQWLPSLQGWPSLCPEPAQALPFGPYRNAGKSTFLSSSSHTMWLITFFASSRDVASKQLRCVQHKPLWFCYVCSALRLLFVISVSSVCCMLAVHQDGDLWLLAFIPGH